MRELIGLLILALGLLIIILGLILFTRSGASSFGIIMIGPIPIILSGDPRYVILITIVSLALFIILLYVLIKRSVRTILEIT
ncbi:MAG: DUF131 domain-containing protein [Sulfolobales archaeon]